MIYEPSDTTIASLKSCIMNKVGDACLDISVPIFTLSSGERNSFFDLSLHQVALAMKLSRNILLFDVQNAEELVCHRIVAAKIVPFLDHVKRYLASLGVPTSHGQQVDVVSLPLFGLLLDICEILISHIIPSKWKNSPFLKSFKEDILVSISRMISSISSQASCALAAKRMVKLLTDLDLNPAQLRKLY
jgi:hypothetical protein